MSIITAGIELAKHILAVRGVHGRRSLVVRPYAKCSNDAFFGEYFMDQAMLNIDAP